MNIPRRESNVGSIVSSNFGNDGQCMSAPHTLHNLPLSTHFGLHTHTHTNTRMVITRSGARNEAVEVPHVGGVRILRGAVHVGAEDVSRLASHSYRGAPIFNPNRLRLQCTIDHSDVIVRRLVDALCAEHVTRGRVVGQAVVLHSLTGCAEQQMHTDYCVSDVRRSVSKPLGVLLALQDSTKLEIPGETVHLSSGDVAIFDGDQPHAGAAYEEPNIRVHLYLDCPGVHRPENTTYFWHDEESPRNAGER